MKKKQARASLPVADDAEYATARAKAAAGELLGPTDIAAIFRIGHNRFAVMNKAGAFDHLKTRPAIGPRCFSGVLVERHLNGDAPAAEAMFFAGGRKRRA